MTADPLTLFEQARPLLTGLAYRVLGSYAEAEDVVQDTFLKWQTADHTSIDHPKGWLTTTCTRRAIDVLRSARLARTDYVGPWLPEPVQARFATDPNQDLDLSDSVTTAFLVTLERLGPKERAAFLLREVFSLDYDHVAASLNVTPETCRKLVSRAKSRLQGAKETRQPLSEDRQWQLVRAFEAAIQSGETAPFSALLSEDITLTADGGGKVIASLKPLTGLHKVINFLVKVAGRNWASLQVSMAEVNSGPALIVCEAGQVANVVTFDFSADGKITQIFVVRNPDKLTRIAV